MIKSYKFRIFPSKKQIRILNQHLEECRWLYNYCLEERREAWKRNKKSLSCFDQQNKLIELKRNKTSLNNVYSQVLQDVVKRVDLAFKGFYRRVKNGERPGYPRFKSKNRYNSLTYPQFGFSINKNNIQLSKIGAIKAKITQTTEGKLKTCTIKRSSTNKWYIILTYEFEPKPLPKNNKIVGIDVGIKHFVVLSDGNKIENPKFILKEEKNIIKAQRKLSKLTKGTKEWEKQRKVVARIYERITWRRQDFIHKLSREIVNKYGIIIIEDLNVKEMVSKKRKKRSLSRLILDAAWKDFCHKLAYKAEWAGRQIVAVNPKYTSQTCSECGFRQEMPLNKRKFRCRNCGLELDRDHNAARNIERLGRQSLRGNPLEACDH
jgi:putative transposase